MAKKAAKSAVKKKTKAATKSSKKAKPTTKAKKSAPRAASKVKAKTKSKAKAKKASKPKIAVKAKSAKPAASKNAKSTKADSKKVAPKAAPKKPVAAKPEKAKAAPVAKTLKEAVAVTPKRKGKPQAVVKDAAPVLKIILCGPHSVYWIPREAEIPDSIFHEGLHVDEFEAAKAYRVPARKNEYLRGRWLVRRVTKFKEALLSSKEGDPQWAPRLLGSISHKEGHVLFGRANPDIYHSIGVDIEKVAKVSEGIEARICNAEESEIIDRTVALARYTRAECLALVFSFKEAIFKAHFPIGRKHFGFQDVTITEIAYDRREIFARMNVKTCDHAPEGHITIGFYNWLEVAGEKFVVVVADERKPLNIDPSLKAELLSDDEGSVVAP